MSNLIPRRNILTGMAAFGLSGFVCSVAAAEAMPSESPGPPLASRLAAYAHQLRYADINVETLEAVKIHLIDSLGCAIAAFDEKPIRICRDLATSVSGGVSTIIGTSARTTPDLAAFVNAAAIRYYDLNDVYVARQASHPSDTIAACLAIAESAKSSAEELITAIVLAYEINCRLLEAFDLTARGWDGTVFTLPAVALAAGKLMKLDLEKMTQAVNIAVNDHIPMGQTRVQTLSDWKGLADAEAIRNAVFAALLARGGLTGPAPIFEGRSGFFQLVSGPVNVDVGAFGRSGVSFRIGQCGMKAFPAQVYTQTAIVAASAVAKELGALDRIAAIEIATTHRGYVMTGSEREKWAPDTRDTADHSLPYVTARAMFDGDVTNESYTPDKLRDPRIRAFMRKITVNEDPAFATSAGNAPPARVTAILDDGRRIARQVENMPGFPGRPMERADVERKFRGNVGQRWPQERIATVLNALWTLERTDDVTALLKKLSLQRDG